MDIAAIERKLRDATAAAIVTDPRVLRRVIKQHRGLTGIGLSVPHARCYALRRDALLAIVGPDELGDTAGLPEQVILLARPTPGEVAGRTPAEILTRLWRSAFHAQVHLVLDARIDGGALTDATVRERIDRIGQTEFDEVRAALRHDDRLLPPGGDREVYTEFAALYLELSHFAPRLLATMFPGLPGDGSVETVLAEDVDPRALLERSCPEGADRHATVIRTPAETTSPTFSTGPAFTLAGIGKPRRPTPRRAARLGRAADTAQRRGNVVRAALLRAVAASGDEHEGTEAARGRARSELERLSARLSAALEPPAGVEDGTASVSWTSQLVILAEQAAARRGLRFPVEARLLYDLQSAAVAHERPQRAVDVATWAISLGKRPIVRLLPATRETRVARYIHAAAKKLRHVRIAPAERKLLGKLLRWASERADKNVRSALRPKIVETLAAVGLRPSNGPERLAQDKLVEELLDQAVDRGFIGLGHLRDALSRNQLKLDNLSGGRELLSGDALLHANARLALSLDGVYRGGEVYLRGLQKLSSIAFGTRPGRLITLYLVLPLGGAFVVVEGVTHLLAPLLHAFGLAEVHLLSLTSFFGTSAVLFGLIHSLALRAAAWRVLGILGTVLVTIFFRVPRWILRLPRVRDLLYSPGVRLVTRRVLVPLAVTAALYFLTPLEHQGAAISVGGAMILFVGSSFVMGSQLGVFLEDAFFDWLGPTWQTVSRHVLPGMIGLIAGTFRAVMDLVERGMYRVDEWLRFREGEPRAVLVPKAVLGLCWFLVAYVVRLYITLLLEPEINPLKHVPVVTVAAKLMIPFTPDLLRGISTPLSPLGPVIAGAIAGTTVFVLPGFFGFLVWELKENWKLYRANRPKVLKPTPIGHHGETMGALMIPGFHSGTLPKLYEAWRRAAQREDAEAVVARAASGHASEGSHGRFREGLLDVERAVRRFVDRELCALLIRSPRWTHGVIEVGAVELGSNRVRVKLSCPALGSRPCEVAFEEQSGHLVASVSEPGFIAALAADGDGRQLLENALAGLYQLAGVDLVREQVEAALGPDTPYDVSDEGLVVWPGKGYATEAIYRLRDRGDEMIEPVVRGAAPAIPPPPVDRRRILYRHEQISWSAWVHAWTAAEQLAAGAALGEVRGVPGPGGAIPRLLRGATILPGPVRGGS